MCGMCWSIPAEGSGTGCADVGMFGLSLPLPWLQSEWQRLEMALILEQVRRSGGLLAVGVRSGRVVSCRVTVALNALSYGRMADDG